MKLNVGEGQAQLFDNGAACFGVAFFEAFISFVAGCIFPSDPHGFFVALGHHGLTQGQGGLAVGKTGAEYVGSAQSAGGSVHTCVRNEGEHTRVTCHFLDAHLNARVNGANQHIDFVALDQFVGVFDAFRGIGLIVHFEPLNVTTAQFAALLIDGHADTVFNGHTQGGESARVGEHQADANFAGLCQRQFRQQQA